MERFIYSAIYYADNENNTSTLLLPDVDVIASSDTVENAFISAKEHLLTYIEWSIKFGGQIMPATSFKDTTVLNPRKNILLVDAQTDAKKIDRDALDKATTLFMNSLFED